MISTKLNSEAIIIKDGDYEIIFSEVFNVYQKKLSISNIAGYSIEINFKVDTVDEKSRFNVRAGESANKEIFIDFFNFESPLGICTTNIYSLINLTDERKLYFSLHAKNVGEESNLIQVSMTFYLK